LKDKIKKIKTVNNNTKQNVVSTRRWYVCTSGTEVGIFCIDFLVCIQFFYGKNLDFEPHTCIVFKFLYDHLFFIILFLTHCLLRMLKFQ